MTVKDIVIEYLRAHKFDGLFYTDGDCACKIDDLFPCQEGADKCEAGCFADTKNNDEEFRIEPKP